MSRFITTFAIALTFLVTSLSAQVPSYPLRLLIYGSSCGPELMARKYVGTVGEPRIEFQLQSSHASTIGVWFVGSRKTNLQLPGTRCSLYTGPILSYWFVTDDAGSLSFNTIVPKELRGSIYMQMALFPFNGSFSVKTSNGLEIRSEN